MGRVKETVEKEYYIKCSKTGDDGCWEEIFCGSNKEIATIVSESLLEHYPFVFLEEKTHTHGEEMTRIIKEK